MRGPFKYIIIVLLATMAFASCKSNRDKIPPLTETYSKKDKNPFGAYVLRQQVEQLYYRNSINDVKVNFATTWRKINDTAAVYINVSRNLFLTHADLTAMLSYVYNGNSLFISSNLVDSSLLDTLGCTVKSNPFSQVIDDLKTTAVELIPGVNANQEAFNYFYIPFYNHFTKIDKENTVVLGSNSFGPNYICIFYGRGRFYLHTEPRALSNYFILKRNNYQYFQQLLSFTPANPEHVYWDDFYNKRNFQPSEDGDSTGFAVLLKYPGMAWAFWLFILFLIIYIVFGGKRRQRIVETIPPNTNTTLAFTETIGRLYLQKKDNRNIADKLITYFMEYIRNQYYLNTNQFNEAFIATVARKSNSSRESMDTLFSLIKEIQQSGAISDEALASLNRQLENFYKNKA